MKYNSGNTLSQGSVRHLKQPFPIKATNLTQSCYKSFKREVAVRGTDIERELSAGVSVNANARLRKDLGDHAICFKFLSNGHSYIVLTVHNFKQLICPRIEFVYNWNILLTTSLDSQFIPFDSKRFLQKR